MHSLSPPSLLGAVALISAGLAALILIHQLVKGSELNLRTRLTLFLGLGALPTLAAISSTADGMHETTKREFCGSCHVMQAHVQDSEDFRSNSLAALHARNHYFGGSNCYTCHEDYGMFGYALTKLNGMHHVYSYFFEGYRDMSVQEALTQIRLYKPYNNGNCMQCHSGEIAPWLAVPEHSALLDKLKRNRVSCVSAGCHGYAHPFSKPDPNTVTSLLDDLPAGGAP